MLIQNRCITLGCEGTITDDVKDPFKNVHFQNKQIFMGGILTLPPKGLIGEKSEHEADWQRGEGTTLSLGPLIVPTRHGAPGSLTGIDVPTPISVQIYDKLAKKVWCNSRWQHLDSQLPTTKQTPHSKPAFICLHYGLIMASLPDLTSSQQTSVIFYKHGKTIYRLHMPLSPD